MYDIKSDSIQILFFDLFTKITKRIKYKTVILYL
jgi:hypothetical protein